MNAALSRAVPAWLMRFAPAAAGRIYLFSGAQLYPNRKRLVEQAARDR
jgi:hypothetical protein